MLTDVDKLLTFPSDKLQRWRHPRHEWSPQRPNSRCPESDSGCVAVLWRFLIYIYIYRWSIQISTRIYQNLPEWIEADLWLDHVGSISVRYEWELLRGFFGAMDHTGPQFSDVTGDAIHQPSPCLPITIVAGAVAQAKCHWPGQLQQPQVKPDMWLLAHLSSPIAWFGVWCLPKKLIFEVQKDRRRA